MCPLVASILALELELEFKGKSVLGESTFDVQYVTGSSKSQGPNCRFTKSQMDEDH